MVDCERVFGWLNYRDRSCLGGDGNELLLRVRNDGLPPEDRQRAADLAARAVKEDDDVLEKAETLVCLAYFWMGQNLPERAQACLTDALEIYQKDLGQYRRQAVVFWLLGYTEWRLRLNSKACGDWRTACLIFTKLAEDCDDARQPEQAAWYREKLDEFQRDLAMTPEEALTWLNLFEPGFLGEDLVELRNQMLEAVNRNDQSLASRLARSLAALASSRPDLDERAEAYLECGLAYYQMQDMRAAVHCIQEAVSLYRPFSHQQAVARWMLGLAEWQNVDLQLDAMTQWALSLNIFRQLEEEANLSGQRERAAWYRRTIDILSRAKVRCKLS